MNTDQYASDSALSITNEYIRLGGRKYRLDDIASVTMRLVQNDPLRDLPAFLVVAGSLLMFALINFQSFLPADWEDIMRIGSLAGILISVAGLLVLIINTLMKTECLYMVQLKGTFGTSCPLASSNRLFVQNLVTSINHALDTSPQQLPKPHSSIANKAYYN